MLKNKLFSVLIPSILFIPLFSSLALADQRLLVCKSEVLENGYRLNATLFIKSFASQSTYYEYCSGTKGLASIVVTLDDSAAADDGVDASFLDSEGAFLGTLERSTVGSQLSFGFKTKIEAVDYLVPNLELVGKDSQNIKGTLSLMFNPVGHMPGRPLKYRDIPVNCKDEGGIFNQCDYWPRAIQTP